MISRSIQPELMRAAIQDPAKEDPSSYKVLFALTTQFVGIVMRGVEPIHDTIFGAVQGIRVETTRVEV